MPIQDQFNLIANEYDANRRKFIPCFGEFYGGSTDFIAANIPAPKLVIDLGAGTGILSAFWYQHFGDADYLLIDVAEGMLDIAKKRFAGATNVKFACQDYRRDFGFGSETAGGPEAIISALSIHHLGDDEKADLFARVYGALPGGGIFANYDQFREDGEVMNGWLSSYWEGQVLHAGLSPDDVAKWRERQKLDRECSVAGELRMLRAGGFKNAMCVFKCQKFAVVIGVK